MSRRVRTLAAFDSTLEALRYVNAISEEESTQWREKMWRAIGVGPPEAGESGTVQLAYLGEGEPPRSERIDLVPQYPRKVTGPSEALEAFGGCLRVVDVEYDDSVTVIRWQIAPTPDVDAPFPELTAALEEDITPGTSSHAENLRLDWLGSSLRINLEAVRGAPVH